MFNKDLARCCKVYIQRVLDTNPMQIPRDHYFRVVKVCDVEVLPFSSDFHIPNSRILFFTYIYIYILSCTFVRHI